MPQEDNKLIKFLLNLNNQNSIEFTDPGFALERKAYRVKHPTEIAALKCMDGRLQLAVITETPPGIIQPYRNLGGKFSLGWGFFGELLSSWVNYAIGKQRKCLVMATYHFSKGDPYRGCAGHNYDTEAAKKSAAHLVSRIQTIFGKNHSVVYPILVGIETDEDALILHGANENKIDLSTKEGYNHEALSIEVQKLYPDMNSEIVADLLPLLEGNIRHIKKVRDAKRPIEDVQHKEQVLAVGRGFDWLHLLNKALIVGPYSFNVAEPVAVAAGLLWQNMETGRIPKDEGVVLMSSAPYYDVSGRLLAEEKAMEMMRFSLETIKKEVPQLLPYLNPLVGTVDQNTMLFNRLTFTD